MKLDELLEACRNILNGEFPDPNAALVICESVVDLLGEAHPCGFEEPRVIEGEVWFTDEIKLGSKSEARALAASILRAADQLPND